ncbi:MAG TPA: hypothetical protein VJ872_10455 [Nocardioides sp.]|nr:hypothetical protein [Nocardioides sp.]
MTRAGVVRIVAAVVVAAAVVAGVLVWRAHRDRDPYAAYCGLVVDHRGLISSATEQGATTGLIAALPSFRALQESAPSDIADDWGVVVTAISNLQDALSAAGVDPATYDRAHLPAGVTAQQRDAIDAAATRLDSRETRDAMTAVDQEARDVCHSPLVM